MNMHLSGCPLIEVNRLLLLRRGNAGKMCRCAHRVESLRCEGSDAIGAKRTCRERRKRVDLTKIPEADVEQADSLLAFRALRSPRTLQTTKTGCGIVRAAIGVVLRLRR